MHAGAKPLSIGVFFHGWATCERRDADVLEEILDSTERADRLGFDIAWYTEQHTRTFGHIWGRVAAPQLLIANAAARTNTIGLGSAVRLACNHDAQALVEEMLTLDLLTNGRARFGFGAGVSGEATGPNDRSVRRELFRTRMREIADILAGGATTAGRPVTMQTRNLTELIYVAAIDERSVALAAQHGFGYLAGMFGGARHAKATELFRTAGGRGPTRAVRMVFLADSDAAAREVIEPVAQRFWDNFTPPSPQWRLAKQRMERPTVDAILNQLGWAVGGPERLTDELTQYARSCRLDGLDVSFHVPGLDGEAANRSMELFAHSVSPALRSTTALAGVEY